MKTIAIFLRLETASHRKRMMGIFRAIGAKSDWDIRIITNEESLCHLLTGAPDERPDGIISGVPYSEETKAVIRASGIPFVGIGLPADDVYTRPEISGSVVNDNEGIGRAAAKHLLSLGDFRSYAYVPDSKNRSWSVLRGQAFAESLEIAGKSCLCLRPEEPDNATLTEFLKALQKPAAVLAAWDGCGADVIHAARTAGIPVPEELVVLGVDDDEMICEHTVPALSSVKTDAEGMGEAAARMLDAIINGRSHAKRKTVRCAILGITERGSTRSPAPATSLIERAISFIRAEAPNGISANDVARHLNVSRRLLDLRFRQYETRSVAELITSCKIERVKRLLADSHIPVQKCFAQAGFGNIAYATTLFKDATGFMPKAWRLQQATLAKPEAASSRRTTSACERLGEISEKDAAALESLARLLVPEASFDRERLAAAIRQGLVDVFVLRRASRIVAAATAVRFTTPTGLHCRIEDVVVDGKHRGKGLGRRIMTEVLETLRQSGVTDVELTSRPSRKAANALYNSLGFVRRKTNVYTIRP